MLAALVAPQPVDLTIGRHVLTVPPHHADQWLLAIADHPVQGVLSRLLKAEDYGALVSAMAAGELTQNDLQAAALDAIRAASGRPWWETVRLVGAADKDGSLYGNLLLSGVDPSRITFAGWCAAACAWIIGRLDEKGRNQFDFDLKLPPQGVTDGVENWDTVEW